MKTEDLVAELFPSFLRTAPLGAVKFTFTSHPPARIRIVKDRIDIGQLQPQGSVRYTHLKRYR